MNNLFRLGANRQAGGLSYFFLLAHRFNDDAFRPLSVELGVINLLPPPETELAVRYRDYHFVMHRS
jgi:hypothetical protein